MIKKSIRVLPDGILPSDLSVPKGKNGFSDYEKLARHDMGGIIQFSLWHTMVFGWCIPTLHISNHGRNRGATERTYAVRISDGAVVRIGGGPHVTERHEVYVRKTRQEALQKYVEMQTQGELAANTVRDRISTRRAQGTINRAKGLTSWQW